MSATSIFQRIRGTSRTGWIGIDIGSQSLKLAQLEMRGGRRQLAASLIIPIPDGRFDAARAEWLKDTLREVVCRRRGFQGRLAACVLSMSVAENRSMNIPPGSLHERRQMIAQELAENVTPGASASQSMAFDFWDAWPVPGETSSTAHVHSIPEDLALNVADALYRSGLNCSVIDGGPFPLARSIEMVAEQATDDRSVAVLDWGHRSVHFAVILRGQPAFSRIFKDCGVMLLAAALGKSLDLTLEESQQLLSSSGLPHPHPDLQPSTDLQELVADSASEPFNKLLSELDKTLTYLKSQREELVPSQIWLAGGGATIRHAAERMDFVTRIPVLPWRLPSRVATPVGHSSELLAQAAAMSGLAWAS